ncbi:unnamed protein product [Dovyalis caffra]|uniref:Uncharacterized protein n=1 Tax=Dovyalis caffra TaxID=77055 RepID=A0AAV1QXN0_9ROSI|nr:unnamed protein product [Dovyalis caffra]
MARVSGRWFGHVGVGSLGFKWSGKNNCLDGNGLVGEENNVNGGACEAIGFRCKVEIDDYRVKIGQFKNLQ